MKKMFYYYNLSIIFFLVCLCAHSIFGYFRMVTYDEIREEGGFMSESLRDVSRIIPSGDPLSGEEIDKLVTSQTLKSLHTLDLSNQENINDYAIQKLSSNETFRRIINLDLSGTSITNSSIHVLLLGGIGTIRDLPQFSSRFGVPSSTLYLTALNTEIVNNFDNNVLPGGGKCFTVFSKGFHLDYFNPVTHMRTSPPVDNAVKMIEITL